MFKVVVGQSDEADTGYAIAAVLHQCQIALAGGIPQAGILLSAIDFDYGLMLNQIQAVFPGLQLIGGTTDGEVSSQAGFQQDSVVLTLFVSDTITIQAGYGPDTSHDTLAAARQAVTQASREQTLPTLCLVIAESLGINGLSIVESLCQTLGDDFPIFGGLTGDQAKFQQTYQFFQDRVMTDSLPVLLFFGPLQFSYGMAHGWTPIARRGKITAAGSNAVTAINGKPALDLYDYYLDGLTPSPEYPLAIFTPDSDTFYLRAPIGCDRDTGSIQFLVDIPPHVDVQIAHATQTDILIACETATRTALERYPGEHPAAALIFSCCTRRYLLGTRTEEEYAISRQLLPANLPIAGFYSYGEIAPQASKTSASLHHETFISLLLGDS